MVKFSSSGFLAGFAGAIFFFVAEVVTTSASVGGDCTLTEFDSVENGGDGEEETGVSNLKFFRGVGTSALGRVGVVDRLVFLVSRLPR